MGAGDEHNGGDTVEAGLPNITASWIDEIYYMSNGEGNGAIRITRGDKNIEYGLNTTTGTNKSWVHKSFDASRSSAVYGNSTTVQPPAFFVYMWRRAS